MSRNTPRLFRRLATLIAVALLVAACGSGTAGPAADDSPVTATNAATDSFPITIPNAFGETQIPAEPTRVATWGWGSTEAAIAAGVFPVAVAEQVWTVGEQTLLPWVEQAYDEAGVAHPTVLSDPNGGAEVPYDEFIAVRPDLILAPYSGLTQEQYDTLSDIAPVVAFPESAWTTSWEDTIKISAQALGRSAAGDAVLAEIESYLAAEAAKHPEFADATLAGVWVNPNNLSVYTAADSRVGILTKLGFTVDPSVAKLDTSDGGFYFDMSYEKVDELAADVIVSYYDTDADADKAAGDAKVQAIPAFKAGKVADMVGRANVSSVSPPTALSFTWEGGMPDLVDKLAAAVAK